MNFIITFLITILYFLVIGLSILLICCLYKWTQKVKEHTVMINELEHKIYENLREIQFKSRAIVKFSKNFDKKIKEFAKDILTSILLTFLPFTKLKAALLLKRFLKNI